MLARASLLALVSHLVLVTFIVLTSLLQGLHSQTVSVPGTHASDFFDLEFKFLLKTDSGHPQGAGVPRPNYPGPDNP